MTLQVMILIFLDGFAGEGREKKLGIEETAGWLLNEHFGEVIHGSMLLIYLISIF